ncbi:hypothetical protein HAX54_049729 [Datura stramonium]|uniref:Uncharacterized protein n=1 Tax=Datura stramonium TaxID=4076 RepID=A0ABS8WNG1_DATST|nr:hypothetical protein [Datura stramonium]
MEFLSKFEPLKSCPDQKFDKLKGDLTGVTAIRRDLARAEKDDATSKLINKVVESYATGDVTRTDDDHHSCGGGYTPLDAGGRYTPPVEKIEALIEAQGVTEAIINKLISKRGIYPSLRISEHFTLVSVKRRRNQIFKALASAKKKVVGTPKMTDGQPTERLLVNLYKYADYKKKKKI